MMRRYATLPDLPSGYPLDDSFAVVVPIARTNLVTNPSFELGTTGITAIGGAGFIRSSTNQYHGTYSMLITSGGGGVNDGVYYDPITLTSGTLYAFSLKFLCQTAGIPYKMSFRSSGGTELAVARFRSTGRWQWQWVYFTPTSTTTYQLAFGKDNSSSTAFTWTDGWQCEALTDASETVSTYIDGDQTGLVPNQQPPAFVWLGTPHASTSQRSGLTRAGGMVVKLKDYSFLLTAMIGLGLALPQNVKTEYARLDGAYDDYTRKPTRQFTLTGRLSGRSYQELRDVRSQIARLLDRDRVGLDQRLLLLHQIDGLCGDAQTGMTRVYAKYQDGLGGNTDNQVGENAAISFEQYLPYVLSDGEDGATLSVQQNLASANRLVLRSASGAWSVIGSGASGTVNALAFDNAGEYLYIGGTFASFNGVANTPLIARYSFQSGAVTAMGTGGAGGTLTVLGIAVGPDGHVWVVGGFGSMGGAANSALVAEWDGSAWLGHTYPGGGDVRAVVVGPNGVVYVGGTDGRVYSWNGSAWTLLGTATGASADIYALAIGLDGNLYASGSFTGGLVAGANSIARYTLLAAAPAWQTLNNAPASRSFYSLAVGPNGLIYVGGQDSGLTTAYIYSYNGVQWTSLGTIGYTGGSTPNVQAITVTPTNAVYFGGLFQTFNGVTLPDSFALWTQATALPIDVNLPGAAVIYAIKQRSDGTLAVGYDTSGTAVAAGTTTVTNTGTAKTYPTIKLIGPSTGTSRVYQIVNYTTGRAIYLNYTINAGETALLTFQPDALSFSSSFRGDIAGTILPGSQESDFFLAPGANILSVYADASTVVASTYWRPAFVSLDDTL